MIAALRASATPALRAWIDAHARAVLFAAAPEWLATLPEPTVAALERARRGVGAPLSDKNAARLFAWIGVTVTRGSVRVPVVNDVREGRSTHVLSPEELTKLRATTGLDIPVLRPFDNGHGFTGFEIALADLSVPMPVLYVTGPGIPTATVGHTGPRSIYSLDRAPETPALAAALTAPGMPGLLASAIGARTVKEEHAHKEREKTRAKREEATARGYATCGVCFGSFAVHPRAETIVQHGYRMGGGRRGYLYKATGDCYGVGALPWEKSPVVTRAYAGALRQHANAARKWADERERGEIRQPFAFKLSPMRHGRQTRTPIGVLTLLDPDEVRQGYTRLLVEYGEPEYAALAAAEVAEKREDADATAQRAAAYARAADEWPEDPRRPGGAFASGVP